MKYKKEYIGNMTLIEIVQSMKDFITSDYYTSKFYDESKLNRGAINAYDEILLDLEHLQKEEFQKKYLNIIRDISTCFEKESYFNSKDEIEYYAEYNNAIVNVLKIIDPKYEYADVLDE